MLIIQQIETEWTKRSRGGAGAVRRNAVPEAVHVPLSRVQSRNLTVLQHQLTFLECEGFVEPREKLIENPEIKPIQIGCAAIDFTYEQVYATFAYTRQCGAPARGCLVKSLITGVNEWGKIVYNGRFSGSEGAWRYEKMVVNVGLFEPPLDDVFTRAEPTHCFRAMRLLY